MGIAVTPIDATLGATVEGLSLAALSDTQWASVLEAFHSYGVLVFPGQHLSNGDQVAFSRRLGALEAVGGRTPGARAADSGARAPDTRYARSPIGPPHSGGPSLDTVERVISRISNLLADGSINSDESSPSMRMVIGNMEWHSDSSFRDPPALASILSCAVPAPQGGETEFADMRAAYDALDAATLARLDGRLVTHSYLYSQGKVGGLEATFTPEQLANMGPVPHSVISVHPATGRRSLFIGRHAYELSGLPADAARELLDSLLAWACQPPRVFTHRWSAGDVVMWDNRCILHRARPWDYTQPRVMWHTRVAGAAA